MDEEFQFPFFIAKDQPRVIAPGFQMHISRPVSAAGLVIGVGSLAGNSGRNV